MKATTYTPAIEVETAADTSGLGGHPRGLTTLFFTEMWERFSYYGMRAILILYMTTAVAEGGLGFATPKAAGIYGLYVGSVYLMSLPGGWIADQVLGTRLAVLVGGIIIAMGHFSMAVPTLATFYGGLTLIVIGTGLLKPNISAMVGGLYSRDDPRRDSGFSLFYMGINLGAFIAPFVCGFLAQHPKFKEWLRSFGVDPQSSWHWGFAAAGVGMTLGLVQYLLSRDRLASVGHRPAQSPQQALKNGASGLLIVAVTIAVLFGLYFGSDLIRNALIAGIVVVAASGLTYLFGWYLKKEEQKPVAVICILFLFSVLFWMAFEQAGSSLNLFARLLTRNTVFGVEYPSSWLQSAGPIMIILLAPVFSWLWLKLKDRQPSSPAKFAYGLLFAGFGFLVMTYASSLTGGGKVSPLWLITVYLLLTIGELCLSPVGLSTVTKLAPARLVGQMMGVWFLSISLGNYTAGWVAGFFKAGDESALIQLFGKVALTTIVGAGILALLTPSIRKLMGRVR